MDQNEFISVSFWFRVGVLDPLHGRIIDIKMPAMCNIAYLKKYIYDTQDMIISINNIQLHLVEGFQTTDYDRINNDDATLDEFDLMVGRTIHVNYRVVDKPLTCDPLEEPLGG
jgi:hypothetical protein